ncbi:MAG: fibronectin type III domain-containing protein [Thiogranum sp.]
MPRSHSVDLMSARWSATHRRYSPFVAVMLFCALICPPSAGTANEASAPRLSVDSPLATAGFFRLKWVLSDGADFELQEAPDPEFSDPRTLYHGADTASVISGKPNGTWHYRVRAVTHAGHHGPWSDSITVTVAHHALSRALIFLSLGFVVFLAIAATVVRGKGNE